jgi:hypothetical protein
MRNRREVEILRILFVGIVVVAATAAAALVAVSPFFDTAVELRTKALDLLRDVLLIGFGGLIGNTARAPRDTITQPEQRDPSNDRS